MKSFFKPIANPILGFLVCGALFGCSSEKDKSSESFSNRGVVGRVVDASYNDSALTENFDCSGFDLKDETLDPKTLRRLIFCLGRNGSLDPYLKLLSKVPDSKLKAILDVFNRELILNKVNLRDLDVSIKQLLSNGKFQPLLNEVTGFLASPHLVRGFAKFLQKISIDPTTKKIRPEYLKTLESLAFELASHKGVGQTNLGTVSAKKDPASYFRDSKSSTGISKDLSKENLIGFLDYLSFYSGQANTKKISDGLKLPISAKEMGLEVLSKKSFNFFHSKSVGSAPYLTMMFWGFADGSLFDAIQNYTSKGSDYWDQLLNLDHLFKYFSEPENKEILTRITRLYQSMNQELPCLDNTLKIPNINMYIMKSWLTEDAISTPLRVGRNNLLELKFSGGFCQYPLDLNGVSSLMADLARNQPRELVITAEFIQALGFAGTKKTLKESNQDLQGIWATQDRYLALLNDYMSDRSENRFSNTMVASMLELSRADREFWPRVFYFLDLQDRNQVSDFIKTFLTPRKELADEASFWEKYSTSKVVPEKRKSILNVWLKLFENADEEAFYQWVLSFASLVGAFDGDAGRPVFTIANSSEALKELLTFNDSNPLFNTLISTFKHATQNESFFNALLSIAALPETGEALEHTYKMSKTGDLGEMLSGIMRMLEGSYKNAKNIGSAPKLVLVSHQNPYFASLPILKKKLLTLNQDHLVIKHLKDFKVLENKESEMACSHLRLDISLDQTSSPLWAEQLTDFGKCLNSDSKYDAIEDFIAFGTDPKEPIRGKPALAFLTEMGRKLFSLDIASERKIVLGEVSKWITSNKLAQWTDLSWFFFQKTYTTLKKQTLVPMQAVFQGIEALYEKHDFLKAHNPLLANLIEDARLPSTVELITTLLNESKKMNWPIRHVAPPLSNEILSQLRNKTAEFEFDGNNQAQFDSEINTAVDRKVYDYWNQVLTWDQKTGYGSADAFKKAIRPMLDELANPTSDVLEYALNFFLSMKSNPYDPQWLNGWFYRLSSKIETIPYYYPGHFPGTEKPNVRLVSQLDLLELIVLDADFTLNEIGQKAGSIEIFGKKIGEDPRENFALRYLSRLAQAGNNLTGWVDSLHSDMNSYYDILFPVLGTNGSWSDQIKNAANEAKLKIIQPELRRRIFNLKQVAHVVKDLNYTPDSQGRNDLSILRDLFQAVHSATLTPYKNVYRKEVNSLSFIVELVRFGLLRNISSSLWYLDRQGNSKAVDTTPVLNLITKAAVVTKNGNWDINPDIVDVFAYLLRKNSDGGRASTLTFDQRYRFISKFIDYFYHWINLDEKRNTENILSRLFLAIANSASSIIDFNEEKSFFKHSTSTDLIKLSKPFLTTDEGNRFILSKLDLLDQFMTSKSTVWFFETLAESELSKKQDFENLAGYLGYGIEELAQGNEPKEWLRFLVSISLEDPKNRMGNLEEILVAMSDDPAFRKVLSKNSEGLADEISNFLVKSQASPILRKNLASSIRNGEFLDLMEYISNQTSNRDELFYKLKFLGSKDIQSQMSSYIEKVTRSVVRTAH